MLSGFEVSRAARPVQALHCQYWLGLQNEAHVMQCTLCCFCAGVRKAAAGMWLWHARKFVTVIMCTVLVLCWCVLATEW